MSSPVKALSKSPHRPRFFDFTVFAISLDRLTCKRYAQMAAGLRRYKVFADAIGQAEAHLNEMGASWSLTGTQFQAICVSE